VEWLFCEMERIAGLVTPVPFHHLYLLFYKHNKFSSVTEFMFYSLIIKIVMAALTRSSYVETFRLSTGQRTVRVSVMSS